MKYSLTFILIAFTVTNIIFLYFIHQEIKQHVEVIDRHGLILSVMLETPEIKQALDTYLQSKQP